MICSSLSITLSHCFLIISSIRSSLFSCHFCQRTCWFKVLVVPCLGSWCARIQESFHSLSSLFLEALLYPRTPGSSCGSFLIPFRSLVKCHFLWHSHLLTESKISMLPTYHLHPFLYLSYFLLSCTHLLPLYHIIICLFSFYVSLPLQCKLCEGGDIFFLVPHLNHEI